MSLVSRRTTRSCNTVVRGRAEVRVGVRVRVRGRVRVRARGQSGHVV